jgi:hypothetical protein
VSVITINIETSGSAFGYTPETTVAEVAMILRKLASKMEKEGGLLRKETLYDSFTNPAGTAYLDE